VTCTRIDGPHRLGVGLCEDDRLAVDDGIAVADVDGAEVADLL
jgi:hypothetical protein